MGDSETLSVLVGTRRLVNNGSRLFRLREGRNMNPLAPFRPARNSGPRCADLITVAERELSAFFNTVTQLFGLHIVRATLRVRPQDQPQATTQPRLLF